ncbi:formylglycine-generating enzyme family protein [Kordiimonas aquimaris]|uniref:formylglycine-generating enzyme family protein n=1 Tax=Kordiimonas aquimaris TaxID=707591 RepID=UPI0021D328C8|nr:formylglycine-generating enzyme family protein [Kordiimonas aquimaris]
MRTLLYSTVYIILTSFLNAEETTQGHKPGTVFQDCDVCPEMVVIPPGTFMMGSSWNPITKHVTTPIHKVTIGYPLAVGKFEVTFDEWDACVEDDGCDGYRPSHIGWDNKAHTHTWGRSGYPVFKVSWDHIQTYLAWLNSKTSGGYRLLSEAEWEYMARAGTTTKYSTGNTITDQQANFLTKGTSQIRRTGNWEKKTMPVGSYPPNAFGIHDVHGNVSEIVDDCFHLNYDGAPTDGSVWTEGSDCKGRMKRGGTWSNPARIIYSSQRGDGAGVRGNHQYSTSHGFRVAKTLSANDPNNPGK